jgi:glycosyltransferase involved in cell wall biosynthesis
LLPVAVKSAYAQTRAPDEVIVVDDGSTDDTPDVLEDLARSLPATFVHVRQPNKGEASARNRGVALATADIIAFLDQDDVWLPTKIERQVKHFEADESLVFAFTAYTKVAGNQRELVRVEGWKSDPKSALRRLMNGCCTTSSTVMVRVDALRAAGPFDERLALGNDWDMWLRLVMDGARTAYVDEALTEYHWHGANMTSDRRQIPAAALTIFGRLFDSGTLSPSPQKLRGRCLAKWHLVAAEAALADADYAEARRELAAALRSRPASVRPGWACLYARTLLRR